MNKDKPTLNQILKQINKPLCFFDEIGLHHILDNGEIFFDYLFIKDGENTFRQLAFSSQFPSSQKDCLNQKQINNRLKYGYSRGYQLKKVVWDKGELCIVLERERKMLEDKGETE